MKSFAPRSFQLCSHSCMIGYLMLKLFSILKTFLSRAIQKLAVCMNIEKVHYFSEVSQCYQLYIHNNVLLPPGKNFSGRYCFFGVLLMFAGALSLEGLNGSQPNFHTRLGVWIGSNPIENGHRWFNRLAAILEKQCFNAPGGLILASSSFHRYQMF